jgi:hypothetical protein
MIDGFSLCSEMGRESDSTFAFGLAFMWIFSFKHVSYLQKAKVIGFGGKQTHELNGGGGCVRAERCQATANQNVIVKK